MNSQHADFMSEVNAEGAYSKDVVDRMQKAIETFKSTQTW